MVKQNCPVLFIRVRGLGAAFKAQLIKLQSSTHCLPIQFWTGTNQPVVGQPRIGIPKTTKAAWLTCKGGFTQKQCFISYVRTTLCNHMNYQYRCAATFSLSQRHSFTKDTHDPHNINATKSWTQNSHNKQTNKCNNYNMSLYVLDELQIHFQVFVSVWVISADCFDQAGWHLKILSTRNSLPLLGYVFFDPALAPRPPRLHLVQIWPATANSPFSLQMFAKFAHIISSRWSALKSVFNFPSVVCRYGSRVELSGKLTGKYDKFKVSPDHDRVQRCKGSNREHIFWHQMFIFCNFLK